MTKDQQSTLMFLETRLVDHDGIVNTAHMNADDMEQAKGWAGSGLIGFGRLRMRDVSPRSGSHWVEFSDEAWRLAHQFRRERADRRCEKKTWEKTNEEAGIFSTSPEGQPS